MWTIWVIMARPTKFKSEFTKKVEKLCKLGATDDEIADLLEVSTRTVYRWKTQNESFCQALRVGKDHADNRIERSLYQKAAGFRYTEQQAIKIKTGPDTEEVAVVDVDKYQVPDTTSMIFWLKNRRPEKWRDKVDHAVEVTPVYIGEVESKL